MISIEDFTFSVGQALMPFFNHKKVNGHLAFFDQRVVFKNWNCVFTPPGSSVSPHERQELEALYRRLRIKGYIKRAHPRGTCPGGLDVAEVFAGDSTQAPTPDCRLSGGFGVKESDNLEDHLRVVRDSFNLDTKTLSLIREVAFRLYRSKLYTQIWNLITNDGEIAGTCFLHETMGLADLVANLAIPPKFQGLGLTKRFLSTVREKNVARITIVDSPVERVSKVLPFAGFTSIGFNDYEPLKA